MAKLRDLFKNQKFKRIGIVLTVSFLIAWGITIFGKKEVPKDKGTFSQIGTEITRQSQDSLSTDSQLMIEESQKHMQQKATQAEKTGGSSVNLRQMKEQPAINAHVPGAEKIKEKRTFTRLPTQINQPQPQVIKEKPKERDQALEERVASVLGSAGTLAWGSPGVVQMGGYNAYLAKKESEKQKIREVLETKAQTEKTVEQKAVLPDAGITAGEILYAIMDTASNSDQGSTPVMATVVSGKWRGARCLGTFKRLDERLVIQFTKMVIKGRELGIHGYAIDPKTSLPGVRSNVDTHFLERWGGLVASAFLQGFGQAISNQGSTTQVTPMGTSTTWHPNLNTQEQVWSALGVVGEKAGAQFAKMFDKPPTVTLKAGTEIGILIL